MFIVVRKKLFIGLSAFFVAVSIFSIATYGISPGIDFTGGSAFELTLPAGVTNETLASIFAEQGIADAALQSLGTDRVVVRSPLVDREEHALLTTAFAAKGVGENRFSSVGPVLGSELRTKAYIAVGVVLLMIVLYIAFVFRKVSHPVRSWKYGVIGIVALAHDVIVPAGVLAYLGHRFGYEADLLFVSALLAILGFSIHDTIVVFDRIRENLRNKIGKTFEETVGISLSDTLVRSINTSLTTLLSLLALYFVGGESTRVFALILSVGVIAGTFSSVFLASPLLVVLEQGQKE